MEPGMAERRPHRTQVLIVSIASFLSLAFPGGAQPAQRDLHTAEGQYQFAEGLYFRRFYDLAEKEFRYFTEKYPEHKLAPEAMLRLVDCLRRQNKTDATLSAINQFHDKWEDHEVAPKLFLWKGEILFNKEKYAQAAACFKRLLFSSDTVTQEAAVYFLGQCQVKESKPAVAFRTYNQIASKPFDGKHVYRPYALFAVAATHQAQNEMEKAARAFERLCTEDNVPAPVLEESLYRLAEIRFSARDFRRAILLYDRVLEEFPNGAFARESGKRRAWAYFSLSDFVKAAEMARAWRERHQAVFDFELDYIHGASLVGIEFYQEALPLFEFLLGDPRVPEDYVRLASFQQIVCLLSLKRYQETLDKAQAFIDRFPSAGSIATVHYFAGEACFALEKYTASAMHLRRAVGLFVGDWEYALAASIRLTDALLKLGKHEEAATVFRRLAGEKKADRRAYYLLRAGEAERRAGNPSAAIADLEKLLADFPAAGPEVRLAMVHLGELYAERGDFPGAEQVVRNLLGRKETEGRARLLFFLGYLLYQQGKYEEAVAELGRSLRAPEGAGSEQTNFYLAGSLLELGKSDEALDIFAKLLSLPVEKRPSFEPSLLFQLQGLYFSRSQFAVSEAICRWLLSWPQGEVVYRAALRLAEILAAQSRLEDAENGLVELLERVAKGELLFAGKSPPKEQVQSVLSEVLFLQGKNDRAIELVETCLSKEDLDLRSITRCRWVYAEILMQEKRPNQALPFAIKCFVLADDPDYTPKAMFLAIRIFAEIGKQEDAATTWQELSKRYPAYAGQKEDDELIKRLKRPPRAPSDPAPGGG